MTIIKLDRSALEAIFSCMGEKQKLELQNCVVQEFAKHHLKGLVSTREIQKAINAIQQEAASLIKEQVIERKDHWNNPDKMAHWLRGMVREELVKANEEAALAEGRSLVEKYDQKLTDTIEYRFRADLTHRIDAEIENLVASNEYIKGLIHKRAMEMLEEKLKG